MLRRDYSKSNKEYFKENKNILIAVVVFLVIGILLFSIFGMNGNFEINGYKEFSITVTDKTTEKYSEYQREIGDIINSFDGKFDSMAIYGEGDDTKFVVRYMNDVSDSKILEINKLVAEKLNVEESAISEHVKVLPIINNIDYVYTSLSILLIIVITTIFAYARYGGASSMAMLIATILGTLSFMSIGAILRLQIGMSYLAMLVILNVLIAYIAISIFESMHKSSWLVSGDYGTAIETALKNSKYRIAVVSVGVMAIGLLFVLLAPSTIKYVSINLMFISVVLLAVSLYVIPFVWNVFITRTKKREYKIKPTSIENKVK